MKLAQISRLTSFSPIILPSSQPNLTVAQIKQALQRVLQETFDRELLAKLDKDSYIAGVLVSNFGVPFDALLQAPRVKEITTNAALIKQVVVYENDFCFLDRDSCVRPWTKPEATTLMLRDIPSSTTNEEIAAIFGNTEKGTCATPVTVRAEMNDTWFVTFATEGLCKDALFALTSQRREFNGKRISARLKTTSAKPIYTGMGMGAGAGAGVNLATSPSPSGNVSPFGARTDGAYFPSAVDAAAVAAQQQLYSSAGMPYYPHAPYMQPYFNQMGQVQQWPSGGMGMGLQGQGQGQGQGALPMPMMGPGGLPYPAAFPGMMQMNMGNMQQQQPYGTGGPGRGGGGGTGRKVSPRGAGSGGLPQGGRGVRYQNAPLDSQGIAPGVADGQGGTAGSGAGPVRGQKKIQGGGRGARIDSSVTGSAGVAGAVSRQPKAQQGQRTASAAASEASAATTASPHPSTNANAGGAGKHRQDGDARVPAAGNTGNGNGNPRNRGPGQGTDKADSRAANFSSSSGASTGGSQPHMHPTAAQADHLPQHAELAGESQQSPAPALAWRPSGSPEAGLAPFLEAPAAAASAGSHVKDDAAPNAPRRRKDDHQPSSDSATAGKGKPAVGSRANANGSGAGASKGKSGKISKGSHQAQSPSHVGTAAHTPPDFNMERDFPDTIAVGSSLGVPALPSGHIANGNGKDKIGLGAPTATGVDWAAIAKRAPSAGGVSDAAGAQTAATDTSAAKRSDPKAATKVLSPPHGAAATNGAAPTASAADASGSSNTFKQPKSNEVVSVTAAPGQSDAHQEPAKAGKAGGHTADATASSGTAGARGVGVAQTIAQSAIIPDIIFGSFRSSETLPVPAYTPVPTAPVNAPVVVSTSSQGTQTTQASAGKKPASVTTAAASTNTSSNTAKLPLSTASVGGGSTTNTATAAFTSPDSAAGGASGVVVVVAAAAASAWGNSKRSFSDVVRTARQ